MKVSKGTKITLFTIALLIIDQVIKILVKTNMTIGQSINVFGDWCQIYFIENIGMAFGMNFGAGVGKLLLSAFRIVLIVAIIIYIRSLLKREDTPNGVLYALAAILCGAMGNIVDCVFYGVIFSESTFSNVAMLFPPDGGYAPLLYGKVVDMFYFPLIDTTWPEWIPFIGGHPFKFFNAIFNFADACISVSAVYLILFQWKFFSRTLGEEKDEEKAQQGNQPKK